MSEFAEQNEEEDDEYVVYAKTTFRAVNEALRDGLAGDELVAKFEEALNCAYNSHEEDPSRVDMHLAAAMAEAEIGKISQDVDQIDASLGTFELLIEELA